MEFGRQYRGGDSDSGFARIGSPIRRRNDEHQSSRTRTSSGDRDVFSKSEKWLPQPPEPKVAAWTNREMEIEGFFSYVQALRGWSQLASEKMATEIEQAIRWRSEIVTSSLTTGQQARSARLFALLKVAFAGHARIDALIRAYEAGCAIHNSPSKPFGSCGYELLRILALEFSLRTRTEAICLRAELLKREFKTDARSVHVVSDLIRMIQVACSKYERLIETLPREIDGGDLRVGPADIALLFIRNLPYEAKQYVLLHSESESWEALQAAALKYERQQRLYTELGAFSSKKFVNEVAVEGSNENEDEDFAEISAVQKGCGRCGKRNHDTTSCKTDLSKVKCFKCGYTGHIGKNCKVKDAKTNQAKDSPQASSKKEGKGTSPQDKGKGLGKGKKGGKGKTKGKGKMFEVGDEQEQDSNWGWDWEQNQEQSTEQPETSGGGSLQMALLGNCSSESFECDFVVVGFPNSPRDFWTFGLMGGCDNSDVFDRKWFEGLVCQQGLCEPLLSSSVSWTSKDQGWWLVDSGASVTVLSKQSLEFFEVLETEDIGTGPKFFAANGSQVHMNKKVVVRTFLDLQKGHGKSGNVEFEIRMSALVGDTSNNILSTTQLVQKGWTVELGTVSRLVHLETQNFVELHTWAGCPWVYLKNRRGAQSAVISSRGEEQSIAPLQRGVVRQNEGDEMHRARGHVPFDPQCGVCQRTRGVTQHRRKRESDGGSIIEIAADFFHWKGHRFLLICEQYSKMIGCVLMEPNVDTVRSNVKRWLLEMGCLGNSGVLSLFTDDEVAVGSVFYHLGVGKDVRVTRASPQSQEMNGRAERSVRMVKENVLCVSEELKSQGLEPCWDEEKAVVSVFEYVCFMLNSHACVYGSSKTPQEFLVGKATSPVTTSAFGAVVLCELPNAVQSESLPRFLEGAYLRPEFNSKSCVCRVLIDGVVREIRPKSIKLVLPLRWEFALLDGLVQKVPLGVDEGAFEELKDSGDAAKGLEDLVPPVGAGPVHVSDVPPTEKAVCPKGGPPMSWFLKYKMYTPGCSACTWIQAGAGRQGKVHSKECCRRYVDWLNQERSKVSSSASAHVDVPSSVPPVGAGHEDELKHPKSLSDVPSGWFDEHGHTAECPACSYLELGWACPKDVCHSDACHSRFSRWSRGQSDDSKSSAGSFPRKRGFELGADDLKEYTPSEPPEPPSGHGQDMDLDDDLGRGVKRSAEGELDREVSEPRNERESRKRSLEEGTEMDQLFSSENVAQIYSLSHFSGVWTGPDVVSVGDELVNSVVFKGSSDFDTVDFGGSTIRVWRPDHGIDDTTGEVLDGGQTFQGMLTEVGNLERVGAGVPLRQSEAEKLAKEKQVRIIPCRWVSNAKVINGEPGVRARIVVKDVAGPEKAKSLGISSPTPSAESIKTAIAVAGFSDAFVWTLDCSAAFMHTPLSSDRTILVKMPLSMSWEDGSPLYLRLQKSLNGIRSASLDWLQFAQSLVKPLNLVSSPMNPCVFTGEGILMVIYVDDILVVSRDETVGKKVWGLFNKQVPTKLTGTLSPHSAGTLKFVGRVIRREEGEGKLYVGVQPGYLQSCFEEYGLSKIKPTKPTVPNLRAILDEPQKQNLSQEAYNRYRRSLGKLAWLSQTREDLHIYIALLSTGQQCPDERFERAIKVFLRFLMMDGEQELSFPGVDWIDRDRETSEPRLLEVFCDASHAPMRTTHRRGISGAYFFVLHSCIKGFSRHQSCVSLSSCESELYGIQESLQEAMGLLPLVRKMVWDFFGGFEGFEAKSFPIRIRTDSESAKQLLEAMDVPRKSRHTEVRVFWVREQLARWATISWIPGEVNWSDILTKCSQYFFYHRTAIGFRPVGPAQLAALAQEKPKKLLILVEVCCKENSSLKNTFKGFEYFGITEKAEERSTMFKLRDDLAHARKAAHAAGHETHVHMHVSCPCTAGSPVRHLSCTGEEGDVRFGELEPILLSLTEYRALADTMSLEWPLHNSLWNLPGVRGLLVELKLTREAVVRLCRVGLCSKNDPLVGVGKRLKFVSDCEEVCRPLRKLQSCSCERHAGFNEVNWTATGFYNEQLARLLNSAFTKALAHARG